MPRPFCMRATGLGYRRAVERFRVSPIGGHSFWGCLMSTINGLARRMDPPGGEPQLGKITLITKGKGPAGRIRRIRIRRYDLRTEHRFAAEVVRYGNALTRGPMSKSLPLLS